jgi:AcrR family transcriptional regulator
MLYAYFGSKEELYMAALRHAGDQLRHEIKSAFEPEDPAERRLWQGILAYLDVVEAHPEWWLMAREAVLRGGPPAEIAREVNQEVIRMIGGEMADAARESGAGGTALEALDMLGTTFAGACEAACYWWLQHPEVPKGTIAMQLMNLVWMGFGDLLEGELWIPEEARDA